MNNEMNNKFIQNLITKYSKLRMNKENRNKLQNELIEKDLEHLYIETVADIFQKKYEQSNKVQPKITNIEN